MLSSVMYKRARYSLWKPWLESDCVMEKLGLMCSMN